MRGLFADDGVAHVLVEDQQLVQADAAVVAGTVAGAAAGAAVEGMVAQRLVVDAEHAGDAPVRHIGLPAILADGADQPLRQDADDRPCPRV